METQSIKISISGNDTHSECSGILGDFLNLDQGMTTDKGMGEDFIKEHCPLEIVSATTETLSLKEKSGTIIEISKNIPTHYTFKEKQFTLTYLGSS